MARVTLVVNDHGMNSETFLRSLAAGLAAEGHVVTEHALRPRAVAVGPVTSSDALPPVRSRRFLPVAAKLLRTSQPAVSLALRRARAGFGSTGRAVRAAAVAAPIVASEPEVVHLSFSGMAVGLADAISLLGDVPVIVSCRGAGEMKMPVLDPDRAPALAAALRRAHTVHAVSAAMADLVASFGIDRSRITVIRPAIDLERFPARGPELARTDPAAPFHLVTVARLNWVKGIEDLLSAVALLRRDGRDVRLSVAGGGTHGDALRYRAHALGVTDRVEFLGARPHDEVRDLIRSADAFVLPSLLEGISNAVLEAMASEVPVVSTTTGGMDEVIDDDVDGILVPPGDPTALADAIRRLADDPSLAAALAAAGRARAVATAGVERQRAEWAALYRTVLGEPSPRSHPEGTSS